MTRYHASYYAHELSRRHSLNDSEKLASALADAQVDLNPHQLDAALFAFRSPLSKGSILADEVGLGKTIEAGLVIAQKWAERKRRILIITPANLRKQWAMEMAEKFYLPSCILETKNYKQLKKEGRSNPLHQNELIICSYQFAARYYEDIMVESWDLAVIDESHRLRNVYKPDNKIARAIKTALLNTPKILLTATPLQNSLMELYGLVSMIDSYAFGDDKSFKTKYARISAEGAFDELKARLAPLCHRTLRRQVLEYIRYTNRIPLTEDFFPTDDEVALYDMVTEYLQKESLYALPNSQRQLITLILRKLLASSTFAIAGALDSLANRLKKMLKESALNDGLAELETDFEEFETEAEEWGDEEPKETLTLANKASIQQEINELELFLDLLSANGYDGKIGLFNGTNSDPLSKSLYKSWAEKYKNTDRVTGSRTADMRAALVDWFRDEAQIMIATEAGAEGINLQFCSMVVNYDLPWNPQRIEQRIGRCHRYGQKHDVVVINFINRNNAADQRVYELLDQKFKLFSGVFGASDEVLGVIESGVEFEKRIAAIYQNCRTTAEIESEFNRLQEEMESQISATIGDTRKKLLENFDADVHDRLRVNLSESRQYLNKYDSMLWKLTRYALEGKAVFDHEKLSFTLQSAISADPAIPAGTYDLTRTTSDAHRYRIGHPLAQQLIEACKTTIPQGAHISFDYTAWPQKSETLQPLVGQSGTLKLLQLSINGADEQDHLIFSAMTDSGETLPEESSRRFFDLPATIAGESAIVPHAALQQLTEQRKNEILATLAAQQANWFEEEIEKLNYWADDKRKGLKAELKEYDEQIAILKKEARLAPNLPDKLAIQKNLRDIDKMRDEAWKGYDEASRHIEHQKDELLDTVEERLKQTVEEKTLFNIRWSMN